MSLIVPKELVDLHNYYFPYRNVSQNRSAVHNNDADHGATVASQPCPVHRRVAVVPHSITVGSTAQLHSYVESEYVAETLQDPFELGTGIAVGRQLVQMNGLA
jgi:hypothetical protein